MVPIGFLAGDTDRGNGADDGRGCAMPACLQSWCCAALEDW
jgi:hypothetical protein